MQLKDRNSAKLSCVCVEHIALVPACAKLAHFGL